MPLPFFLSDSGPPGSRLRRDVCAPPLPEPEAVAAPSSAPVLPAGHPGPGQVPRTGERRHHQQGQAVASVPGLGTPADVEDSGKEEELKVL